MNTVKNLTIIHLQLNQIDVLKIVILLMTNLIKYMFQTKQKLNLSVFNMIRGTKELKILTKHISCKCKCIVDGKKFNSDQWWKNDKY